MKPTSSLLYGGVHGILNDHRYMVTGSTSPVIGVWKTFTSKRVKSVELKQVSLLRGHSSGITCVRVSQVGAFSEIVRLAFPLILSIVHVGPYFSVLSYSLPQEWSIVVSGSRDRTCIIWVSFIVTRVSSKLNADLQDANRYRYVRTLSPHSGPVRVVAISPTRVRRR